MKIAGSPYRLIMKSLEGDKYGIKSIPQGSFKSFLDIGANIGVISVLVRLVHPLSKIVAIEPDPDMFDVLKENCEKLKIKCVNKAFSDSSDKKFYLDKRRKSSVCNRYVESVHSENSVESISLQELFKSRFINPEDTFLKMDCEGSEKYLVGDKESEDILKKLSNIAIEVHGGDIYSLSSEKFLLWFYRLLLDTHHISCSKEEGDAVIVTAIRKKS